MKTILGEGCPIQQKLWALQIQVCLIIISLFIRASIIHVVQFLKHIEGRSNEVNEASIRFPENKQQHNNCETKQYVAKKVHSNHLKH